LARSDHRGRAQVRRVSLGHGVNDDDETDAADDAWYKLPTEKRWKLAMEGLRKKDPWLELKPENFRTYHFGGGIDAFKINEARALEGAKERKARRDAAEARGERPSIMDMD
jgi:hypothetical protein